MENTKEAVSGIVTTSKVLFVLGVSTLVLALGVYIGQESILRMNTKD